MLRARPLGEADRVFTLLTRERGKVDAVAKGVRRPRSSMAGRLEPLAEVCVALHKGRSLDVIVEARTVASYWTGLARPDALATASLFAETIDLFCEPDLALPEIYALLAGAIRAVSASASPATLVPRFQLRLLHALGLAPADDTCVRCGAGFDRDAADAGRSCAWLDLDAGGLGCERCYGARGDAQALDARDVDELPRARCAARRRCGAAGDLAGHARGRRPRDVASGQAPEVTRARVRVRAAVSVIALDVGTKRIGIAIGEGTFAFPHATLERTNVRDDVARIVALADERGARTIVVGDPLTLGGERALASEKIDAFVAHLERAFGGAIERVDERLTTAAAQKALIAADVSRAKRRQVVDQLAAVGILETWLARRRP